MPLTGYSQAEYSNWYFGINSGITFNTPTGNPAYLPGNRLGQFEGVATISDKNGNILIYTNGEFLINRFGNNVNIGNPLFGHQSSTQSAIIIPKPNSQNIYYVFTADAGEYTGSTNRGINYSIFDISANLGQGTFTEMNRPLLKPASEQLSACYHANGSDVWIVARGWKNNNFYSYLLTSEGIVDTVITSIGFTRTNDFHTIGCLKFSPNGNLAVTPVYDEQFFEMYRFDNKTGEFYNRLQINVPDQVTLYGAEFSSNGKVLYISASKNAYGFYSLYQFDVSEYNAQKISNSQIRIANKEGHIGTLQRGINNKIYIAPLNIKFLHSIENPNTLGTNCRFQEKSVELLDSTSQLGLPQVFRPAPNSRVISACVNSDVFLDTDDFLADTSRYPNSYKWTGPNSWESFLPKPLLEDVQINQSGLYTLTVTYQINGNPFTSEYKIQLNVGGNVSFKINGQDTICVGTSTTLSSDTLNPSFTYIWNTGRRASFLTTSSPGLYKLYIINQFGCIDSAIHRVTIVNPPKAKISGNKLICNNQPVTLKYDNHQNDYSYLWSNGEITPEITVTVPGTYKLVVTSRHGCKDSASVKVVRYPNMQLKIVGDTVLCVPGTAELIAKLTPFDSTLAYRFLWNTGDSTSKITVNKPGTYQVSVIVENICLYTDSILIKKSDIPKLEINVPEIVEICDGESVIVNLLNKENHLNYSWNDGYKVFPRLLKSSGKFYIVAENVDGCFTRKDFELIVKDRPKASIQFDKNVNICNADSVILNAFPKGTDYSYQWLGGSNADTMIIRQSGTFYLVVKNELGCSDTTSIKIELGKGLPVNITGNNVECEGNEVILKAGVNFIDNADNFTYKWSTGETSETINPKTSGNYHVTVTHISGCTGYDTINVDILSKPFVQLNYSNKIDVCEGDSVEIFPINTNSLWDYYWQDGSVATKKTIKQSGVYKVYVYNKGMCKDSSEIEIVFVNKPIAKIISLDGNKLCKSSSIKLVSEYQGDDVEFEWMPSNLISKELTITSTGWYYLKITNSNGCVAFDSINIQRALEPSVSIINSKPYLCENDELLLTAGGKYDKVFWSNGDTTVTTKINKPGYYSVTVISADGCTASDFTEISKFTGTVALKISANDFGSICPGRIAKQEIVVSNPSNSEMIINRYENSNNVNFVILSDLSGLIIPPKSDIIIPVDFRPTESGTFSSNFKIYYSHSCPDSVSFTLSGKSNIESEISLPDILVESGNSYCIPVNYKFDCAESVDFVTSLKLKISFNAEYFVPDSVSVGKIVNNYISNSTRHLEIEILDYHFNNMEGVVTNICGRALIGYDTATTIFVDELIWSDNIKSIYKNGSISTELCVSELRPIKLFKPTNFSISPNPVCDFLNLTVNSQEKGIFVVELINQQGNVVKQIEWQQIDGIYKEQKFNIPANDISSGLYMLVLKSPWYIFSSKVLIVK